MSDLRLHAQVCGWIFPLLIHSFRSVGLLLYIEAASRIWRIPYTTHTVYSGEAVEAVELHGRAVFSY